MINKLYLLRSLDALDQINKQICDSNKNIFRIKNVYYNSITNIVTSNLECIVWESVRTVFRKTVFISLINSIRGVKW